MAVPSLFHPRLSSALPAGRLGLCLQGAAQNCPISSAGLSVGGRTGRKSCGPDPRPLSCFWAGPTTSGCGTGGGGQDFEELQLPCSEGQPLGIPCNPLQPPRMSKSPCPPPAPGSSPAPPPRAPRPLSFSRLDLVGESAAPEHSQGAEQQEGGAHGWAAPSPPGQVCRGRPRWPLPALQSPRFLLLMD